MGRGLMLMLAVGLGAFSAILIAVAMTTEQSGLSTGIAWAEPYVGPGGMVIGGLAMAGAFLLFGLGMGRWRNPRPVPDATERHHEGVQG